MLTGSRGSRFSDRLLVAGTLLLAINHHKRCHFLSPANKAMTLAMLAWFPRANKRIRVFFK